MNSKDKILDELLIMKMKDGDSKSLSLFVKRWHSKLIWFSFQTIHDKEEAQDIVQESWAGIIKGLQNLNEIRSYKSWMFRVIRNKTIDKIRKIQRERVAMENFKLEDIGKEELNNSGTNSEIVLRVLQTLTGELKEILQLFYLENQSVEELSLLLSIPKGTVKSRLFRAREQMKKSLHEIDHLLEF
jgi:RNA polymerase sigma-70 factor (ECF subfamily)